MPGNHSVRYIPSQIDDNGVTSQPTARNSPLVISWRDLSKFWSLIPNLPALFLPVFPAKATDELSLEQGGLENLSRLAFVTLCEVLLLGPVATAVLFLPGVVSAPICVIAFWFMRYIWTPLQGPVIYNAKVERQSLVDAARQRGERWIYVNGIVVTSFGFRQNCERLARTFGRPITGIHNPTYGLLSDILECIIQRAFSYNNYPVRATYDRIKAALVDPTSRTVVLLCHSQGAIIVSMALDMLFADLRLEQMEKLEVYTFGSAAAHFNNPLREADQLLPVRQRAVISHIEHYVNGDDIVPQWGVLQNAKSTLENKYAGDIFIRMNATGHMMNQHYLSNMFPLPEDVKDSPDEQEPSFLDQIVEVDEVTAEARKYFIRRAGILEASPSPSRSPLAIGSRLEVDTKAGKSVKQLSRLWRYMGGGVPDIHD